MNGHLPSAVVGGMDEVKVGNEMAKACQYPWGVSKWKMKTTVTL